MKTYQDEEIEKLRHDIEAYRGALGYPVPASHDGKLSDGTTPVCGLCNSQWRRQSEALADLVRWMMEHKYSHLIHRHDGSFRMVDEAHKVSWESDDIEKLLPLIEAEQERRRKSAAPEYQTADAIIKAVDEAGYLISGREKLREEIATLIKNVSGP